MGIRFRCHHCESELHVKDFQAGKRGRCPNCGGRFRVPLQDAPRSLDPQAPLPQPHSDVPQLASQPTSQPTSQPNSAASPQSHVKPRVPDASAGDSAHPARINSIDASTEAPAKARHAAHRSPAAVSSPAAPSHTAAAQTAPSDTAAAQAAPSHAAAAQPASPTSLSLDTPTAATTSASSLAPPLAPPLQPAVPQALQLSPEATWYVRPPSGGQYGPANSTTMWQWLTENRVGRDALVWAEGWPEWLIADAAFNDYFQAAPASSAAMATPPAPAAVHHAQPAAAAAPAGPNPSLAAAAQPADPLLADRNRAERKQKRRRNYTIMIAGLTVVMLVLIGTLIFVLGSQAT